MCVFVLFVPPLFRYRLYAYHMTRQACMMKVTTCTVRYDCYSSLEIMIMNIKTIFIM